MVVDSIFEFYIILFGWFFYNSIWDVFVVIGMVFLFFLGILIDIII